MSPQPRRGRRPGDPEETRQAILAAARAEFARAGYDGATIRSIGAAARVDPALIHHHFGTKEDLFVAAYEMKVIPASIAEALTAGKGTPGERLARAYLTTVTSNPHAEGLLRSAAANERARELLRDFIERTVFDVWEERLQGDHTRLRVSLAAAQLFGVMFLRRFVRLTALTSADLDEIVRWVAPALDLHLGDVHED